MSSQLISVNLFTLKISADTAIALRDFVQNAKTIFKGSLEDYHNHHKEQLATDSEFLQSAASFFNDDDASMKLSKLHTSLKGIVKQYEDYVQMQNDNHVIFEREMKHNAQWSLDLPKVEPLVSLTNLGFDELVFIARVASAQLWCLKVEAFNRKGGDNVPEFQLLLKLCESLQDAVKDEPFPMYSNPITDGV